MKEAAVQPILKAMERELNKRANPHLKNPFYYGGDKVYHDTLVRIGKPAVPYLIKKLECSDDAMKINAIYLLKSIGDTRAVKPFLSLLRSENDNDLYQWLVEALASFFDKDPNLQKLCLTSGEEGNLSGIARTFFDEEYEKNFENALAGYYVDGLSKDLSQSYIKGKALVVVRPPERRIGNGLTMASQSMYEKLFFKGFPIALKPSEVTTIVLLEYKERETQPYGVFGIGPVRGYANSYDCEISVIDTTRKVVVAETLIKGPELPSELTFSMPNSGAPGVVSFNPDVNLIIDYLTSLKKIS